MLLLHGFPETSLSWASVTPLLAQAGLRTYAPDQLGYSPGARPGEVDAYSMPNLAQVTADLMTALDVPRRRRRRPRLGRERGVGAGRAGTPTGCAR